MADGDGDSIVSVEVAAPQPNENNRILYWRKCYILIIYSWACQGDEYAMKNNACAVFPPPEFRV
jgi:hypothetical protein